MKINLNNLDVNLFHANYILDLLKQHNINAVVAGGYIRDKVLGKRWNDIDVYILSQDVTNNNHTNPFSFLKDTLKSKDTTAIVEVGANQTYYHRSTGPLTVYETKMEPRRDNIVTYQFMFVDNYDSLHNYIMDWFDFGLCMCYYDGEKISLSNQFLHDAKNNKLTIAGRKITRRDISYIKNRHAKKLKKKYKNFTVELNERLENQT